MTKGTLKYVYGDVTNPQRTYEKEVVVIPHCCNNLGVSGGGVIVAIKRKWPQMEKDYLNSGYHIGSVSYTVITENDEINTVIANMVAQDGIISPHNPKPIKYQYLVECMQKVFNFVDAMKLDNPDKDVVIHAPKFGSLRSNGNWDFIEELIQEIWIDKGIDVTIYEFKE